MAAGHPAKHLRETLAVPVASTVFGWMTEGDPAQGFTRSTLEVGAPMGQERDERKSIIFLRSQVICEMLNQEHGSIGNVGGV